MEAFGLLIHGFAVLMTWKTIALMMVGLVLGIFVGVLPGLGGPNGVAILLPLTFTMDPTSAIVMLSCIYWGALFGGAITSILFNIPGEAWSVATTFDGYPMAQQGRAAEALTAAFTSSFIGSLVAVLLITFLAPMISSFALKFGPPEFFAVYLLTFCSFVGLGRAADPREPQVVVEHLDPHRLAAAAQPQGERLARLGRAFVAERDRGPAGGQPGWPLGGRTGHLQGQRPARRLRRARVQHDVGDHLGDQQAGQLDLLTFHPPGLECGLGQPACLGHLDGLGGEGAVPGGQVHG